MTLDELKEIFFGKSSKKNNDSKYYEWAIQKRNLNLIDNFPRPKKRQVWWCVIGKNVGSEQSCDEGFERPVLVVRVFGSIFWGIPITSSDPENKKETNPLYFKLEETQYTSNSGEIKTLHGFIALHQMRVYDGRRLKRKILKIDNKLFEKIIEKVRSLI